MADDTTPSDVASRLRLYNTELRGKKDGLLKSINGVHDELKKLFANAPEKPRESLQDLELKIEALEFERTTNSLVLADERKILREIESLERTKAQIRKCKEHEATIQDKKTELSLLRDSFSETLAAIDELRPAMARVRLAEKLGCSPTEITSITIEYPPEKTGRVIGKKGATIKGIREKSLVAVNVDSTKGQIEITGGEASLERAVREINKITQAVDEDLEADQALVTYLSTRHIPALAEIRERHPDVYFNVHRNGTTVHLHGLPDDIAAAKSTLLALDVKQDSRPLTSHEVGAVLGRKGANIKQLLNDHKVSIAIDKDADSHKVTVAGPSTDFDAAWKNINEIVEENAETVERVNIRSIVCGVLLANGGERIRQLQQDINERTNGNGGRVSLNVSKEPPNPFIVLKGRRSTVHIGREILNQTSKEILDSAVDIAVDPSIIPYIIGKAGSNMQAMRLKGNGVVIEVDSDNKIYLFGANADDVEVVADLVHQTVEAHQLGMVDVDQSNAKRMYRALLKAKGEEINNILTHMLLDEDASKIVLRGSTENIKVATDIILEFFASNYVEDVPFSPEHEFSLLTGGKKCMVNQTSQEFDVEMGIVRSTHVITFRGKKDNVMKAKERLMLFLNGGDDYAVTKVVVSVQALGAVIGKGGSMRCKLEAASEGAKMFINEKNGVIFIRGPHDQVERCRADVVRIVSLVPITQSLSITAKQHAELSKPNVIKRLTEGIPVQVSVKDDAVSVRGVSSDVKDVLAFFKDQLTGIYESHISLDQEQYAKVSSIACKDAFYLNPLRDSTAAVEIELDPSSKSIVIKGKRSDVTKAKLHAWKLLDFLLPLQFNHVKIPKIFQSTVATAASLADVSALSGASVILDRDLNLIQINSSDAEKMAKASNTISSKIAEAEKLMFEISIDRSEAWLIPAIIGQGGDKIKRLRVESGCRIDVSKEELTVSVIGGDEASLAKARESLDAVINKARRECVFVELPSKAIPAFLGKGGSRVKDFSKQHDVEINRTRRDESFLKITGSEASVLAAHAALLDWIDGWKEQHADVSISVVKSAIPAVTSRSSTESLIDSLEEKADRELSMLTVEKSEQEKRREAIQKLTSLIMEKATLESAKEEKEPYLEVNVSTHAKGQKTRSTDKPGEMCPTGKNSVDDDSCDSRTKEPVSSAQPGQERFVPDVPLVGTTAGRGLFNLLVSDPKPNVKDDLPKSESMEAPPGVRLSQSEDTESSRASTENAVKRKMHYYKSASGLAIRR